MSFPKSILIPDPAHLRCTRCDDVIGVYEPMVVVRWGDEARESSCAAEAALPLAGAEHFHSACYAAISRA